MKQLPEVLYKGTLKKVLLKISQNLQENTCAQTPAQLFSYEFCQFFKNTFSTEYLQGTASGLNVLTKIWNQICSI